MCGPTVKHPRQPTQPAISDPGCDPSLPCLWDLAWSWCVCVGGVVMVNKANKYWTLQGDSGREMQSHLLLLGPLLSI